jgi:hypothetical protein
VGWAERQNVSNGLPRILATRLSVLRAAIDVQHAHRQGRHAADRGSIYTLPNGTHIAEADAATIYAAAMVSWLRARGAAVLTNNPATGALCGPYSSRNHEANLWGASCYVACHVNAGGGSYAATEYMAGTSGDALGLSIRIQLGHDFPEIKSNRGVPLAQGQRGAVCIEAIGPNTAAIVLEPFFGDTPWQQGLFAAPKLHQLGETTGEGIAQWWERRAGIRVA